PPTTTTTVPASTSEPSTTSTTVATTEAATTTTVPLDIDAECGAFNSLDVTMPADATMLSDDVNWITTNGVIPLISAKGYTPGASQVIDQVSQALRTDDLRAMLRAVSKGTQINLIASNYLSQAGITGGWRDRRSALPLDTSSPPPTSPPLEPDTPSPLPP